MLALKLNHISLIYHSTLGETSCLTEIDFSVEKGEFVAIVGPSGCGKTTILSIISGLLKPEKGNVEFFVPQKTGYMLQKDQLFEWRTIWKNTLLGLEIQKQLTPENKLYAENLLKKYNLWDFRNHHPRQLSGGMRQRAALIRTLVLKPEILLLDEPFSALDYFTRIRVCDDVYSILKKEEKTALLVTHDIAEAISMADKIIVLSARPSSVKKIIQNPIQADTPRQRRDSVEFRVLYDQIWKELQENA